MCSTVTTRDATHGYADILHTEQYLQEDSDSRVREVDSTLHVRDIANQANDLKDCCSPNAIALFAHSFMFASGQNNRPFGAHVSDVYVAICCERLRMR